MDAHPDAARAAIISLGGVARVRALHEAGVSRHAIDRAIARGHATRVRRGWLATPDADPFLVAAARGGVILTCVTAARRLGLWVLDDDRPHVAAPAHAGRINVDAVVHWHAPAVPRQPDALVDPIENVLISIARCRPYEQALVVWESALRRRSVDRERMRRLALPPAARRVCDDAGIFADSGLETLLPARLRWLRLPMLPQAWILDRPVDLLIGERLVLQCDGGHHVGAQRASDIEHDARLMLCGYHVIRVTYRQVIEEWPQLQTKIAHAVAQGLHRAR